MIGDSFDLVAELDLAAKAILDRARGSVILPDGTAEQIPLSDQLEAFSKVVAYAEKRMKLQPAPEETGKGSPFHAIREQFHQSEAPSRRTGASKAKNGAAAPADA